MPAIGAAEYGSGRVAPRRFSRLFTWMAGLSLAALLVAVWVPAWTGDRIASLRYPAESAARLMERHLQFYVGLEQLPAWERNFYVWLFDDRETALNNAAHAYRDVLAHFAARPGGATDWAVTNTRARLALVLLEAGKREAAAQSLSEFGFTPEDSIIEDTIRYAYQLEPNPVTPGELQAGVRLMPLGWATDTLALRLAERDDEAWLITRIQARQFQRAESSRESTRLLAMATGGMMLAGGLILLALLVRAWARPGSISAASAMGVVAPASSPGIWSFEDGIAVLVRAGLLGVSIFLLLGMLDSWFEPHLAARWSTLLASVPMIWMMHRHLLAPRGLGLVQALGLNPVPFGILRLLGLTLVLLFVERAGSLLISWALWHLDVQPHWAEGLAERWIWGPWPATLMSSINTIAWAPVLEEIGFRGLLFLTLRSRFGFAASAIMSAAAFSLLHPYSLAALLGVFWSGLIWAWAFERFRTLLPAILGHAAGNLLAVGTILMFYR